MKSKFKPKKENILVSQVVSELLKEIKFCTKPIFEFWANEKRPEYYDNFNPVRIIMPLLETTSKIKLKGRTDLLLEELGVPEPVITWKMFRHGLMHSIRPFFVQTEKESYCWGIGNYSSGKHYLSSDNTIIIYPKKIILDLEKYLEKFRFNQEKIEIQTGLQKVLSPSLLKKAKKTRARWDRQVADALKYGKRYTSTEKMVDDILK